MLGGLAMVSAILTFILVHEAGHYLAARATGMKATEFFVGFGPKLWSFQRGETEFGIKAFPIGGYVRIVGMHNRELVAPEDASRAYRNQPLWKKSTVVLSGVVLNLIMAFVLIFGLVFIAGRSEPTTMIAVVTEEIADGVASPARLAGVLAGDELMAIEGVEVTSWAHAVGIIHAHPGERVEVEVRRSGQRLVLEPELAPLHPARGDRVGFLGVSPAMRRVGVSPWDAAVAAAKAERDMTTATIAAIARIVHPDSLIELGGAFFGRGEEVPDEIRPVSPIGLVQMGSQANEHGIGTFVIILAVTNVTLAVVNSLPLFPLDGGHFAVAVYEKLARRSVDARRLMPVAVAVVMILAFLGLVAIVLDISNPISL